jgi:hypothetical protein
MMSSRRGYFESALGALLTLDVGKIRQCVARFGKASFGAEENLDAPKMIGDLLAIMHFTY